MATDSSLPRFDTGRGHHELVVGQDEGGFVHGHDTCGEHEHGRASTTCATRIRLVGCTDLTNEREHRLHFIVFNTNQEGDGASADIALRRQLRGLSVVRGECIQKPGGIVGCDKRQQQLQRCSPDSPSSVRNRRTFPFLSVASEDAGK